jgi:large subunit ribosomal protein L31
MADKEKKEPKEQKAQKDDQKKEQKQSKGPKEGKEASKPAAQGPGADIAAQKQALKEAKKKGKPVEAAPAAGGAEQPKEKPKKGGEKAASNLFVPAVKVISSRKEGVSRKTARKSIHPKYMPCKIICGCGNVVMTRATVPEIQVGVCANCHPFYTGTQKFVDSAGRVEKFQQRYKWTADKAIQDGDAAAVKKAKKFRNK